jgi:two-component system, chemotaxis family, chemotaxis protein CheY
MPKLNGIEALKEIIKFDPKAKIVICSSLGQSDFIIEALKIGAKDFIVKPYFKNLLNILNNYL